jgi:poly-gamma-glutamate synthase PgsB/CapB
VIISFLTLLFLFSLVLEKLLHQRRICSIPLRICVTGTRGKSSVTRMLASVLREGGRTVLAKTTGSQPCVILPDGTEVEIPRRGLPGILEQKQLIKKGSALGVDSLVAELMSIRPENHYVESRHLLQPTLVAVTNVRRDHTEVMGGTEEKIASVFRLAIPPGSTAFVPEADARHFSAQKLIEKVADNACAPVLALHPELRDREFIGDLDLVYSLAKHLGIPEAAILAGILKTRHDIGHLRIWVWRSETRTYYLGNAFAANDPDSTLRALAKVRDLLPSVSGVAGFLSLRADRPDRTAQWISELKGGALSRFDTLFVTGACSKVVRRRLGGVRVIKPSSPEQIMTMLGTVLEDRTLVFGFGNMAGAGRTLVEYWARTGEPYAV